MRGKAKQQSVRAEQDTVSRELVNDVRRLVEETRTSVSVAVNAALTMLHWQIGVRVNEDILQGQRAQYGKQILQALCAKLSWAHFLPIIYIDDPLRSDFYAEMCHIEKWIMRTLQKQIDSPLYERTALSRKPEYVIQHEPEQLYDADRLSPDLVLNNPYALDFLELNDVWKIVNANQPANGALLQPCAPSSSSKDFVQNLQTAPAPWSNTPCNRSAAHTPSITRASERGGGFCLIVDRSCSRLRVMGTPRSNAINNDDESTNSMRWMARGSGRSPLRSRLKTHASAAGPISSPGRPSG